MRQQRLRPLSLGMSCRQSTSVIAIYFELRCRGGPSRLGVQPIRAQRMRTTMVGHLTAARSRQTSTADRRRGAVAGGFACTRPRCSRCCRDSRLEHVALLQADQRIERALAAKPSPPAAGCRALAKPAIMSSTDPVHGRRIAGLGCLNGVAELAAEGAVQHHQFCRLVGEIGGRRDHHPPGGGVAHEDHLAPSHMVDDRHRVADMGVERIVLARAPIRLAPAAPIEGHHPRGSLASAPATPIQS